MWPRMLVEECLVLQFMFASLLITSWACSPEKHTAPRGRVSSPEYPRSSPNLTKCEWWIHAPDQHLITISFSDLDMATDRGGQCRYTRLEVEEDSSFHNESLVLCGSTLPDPYISRGNRVRLVFWTDGTAYGRGFLLTYISSPRFNITCAEDEFQCHNAKCILSSWRCNCFDECGDRSDEQSCKVENCPWDSPVPACGSSEFSCRSASSNKYECFPSSQKCDGVVECAESLDELDCNGALCGGILGGPYGSVQSPLFPHNYPPNVACEWLIQVAPDRMVQLRFDVFRLELYFNTDAVSVFDGEESDSNLIGIFYGAHPPPPLIEATSSRLFIKFRSNGNNVTATGFNATYQEKGLCWGAQVRCGDSEPDSCYEPRTDACDGRWNCRNGKDEKGCSGCPSDKVPCLTGNGCFLEKERCNGIAHCLDNSDERNCDEWFCNEGNGTFLCQNRRCIYESWRCDGTNDCEDGSDELACIRKLSRRVITAAVLGATVCSLLLIIALGCTCKLWALRAAERRCRNGDFFSAVESRRQSSNGPRRLAPPSYNQTMGLYDELEQRNIAAMEHIRSLLNGRTHARDRRSRRRSQPVPSVTESLEHWRSSHASAAHTTTDLGASRWNRLWRVWHLLQRRQFDNPAVSDAPCQTEETLISLTGTPTDAPATPARDDASSASDTEEDGHTRRSTQTSLVAKMDAAPREVPSPAGAADVVSTSSSSLLSAGSRNDSDSTTMEELDDDDVAPLIP